MDATIANDQIINAANVHSTQSEQTRMESLE